MSSSAAPPAQWELELEQVVNRQQSTWARRHGTPTSVAARSAPAAAATRSAGDGSCLYDHGASQLAQLVLLDFGLAEELTPEVRGHFISFLNAVSAGDGLSAARHLLSWSRRQTCLNPPEFKRDMMQLFAAEANIYSKPGIDLDLVMKECLRLARKHSVSIDSCYASLVINVCVIVGFGKALDPGVNIMDAATPCLLAYAMTGKVVGRLYS
jgi:aarF domain-containing kinase